MKRWQGAVGLFGAGMLGIGTSCATAEDAGEIPVDDAGLVTAGAGGAGTAGVGGNFLPSAGGFVPFGAGGTPVAPAGGRGPGGGTGAGGGAPCSACTAPPNGAVVCTAGACDFTCNSGYAKSGTTCARIVSCTDGMANGSETDVDCGGGTCPKCAPGLACKTKDDCAKGPCEADGKCGCTPETCESALSCAAAFDDGCGKTLACAKSCVGPAFCFEEKCCTAAVACEATTCSPTFDDGCGKTLDCTDNCAATDVCFDEKCCTAKACDATTCGHTTDGCGTDLACPPCADGGSCATADDCESALCEGGKCVSCTDGKMNNGETDTDCGGANCPTKCAGKKKCKDDADCESGTCCAAFGPFSCILQPGNTCQ